jgi:hypothetical protein
MAVAPALLDRMFLFRPLLVEPPLCSLVDMKTRLTLLDVADLHEVIDLKAAAADKAERVIQARKKRRP